MTDGKAAQALGTDTVMSALESGASHDRGIYLSSYKDIVEACLVAQNRSKGSTTDWRLKEISKASSNTSVWACKPMVVLYFLCF